MGDGQECQICRKLSCDGHQLDLLREHILCEEMAKIRKALALCDTPWPWKIYRCNPDELVDESSTTTIWTSRMAGGSIPLMRLKVSSDSFNSRITEMDPAVVFFLRAKLHWEIGNYAVRNHCGGKNSTLIIGREPTISCENTGGGDYRLHLEMTAGFAKETR